MVESGTIAITELSATNYQPTELAGVIDHFLCKLCGYVVHKPKECPQCSQTFCHDCVQDRILSTKNKWQCPNC